MTFQLEKEFRSSMWISGFKYNHINWFRKYIKKKLFAALFVRQLSAVSVNSYCVAKEWFEVQNKIDLIFLWLFINSGPYDDKTSFFPETQRYCLLSCNDSLYIGTKFGLIL
jgi:hypothetical protein